MVLTWGGWYLNIPATDWQTNAALRITTDSLLVEEGMSYEIKYDSVNNTKVKGYFYSEYTEPSNAFIKTNYDTGSVRILKFDKVNRILSGTFSYSATRLRNGDKIKVTEGRFAIRY